MEASMIRQRSATWVVSMGLAAVAAFSPRLGSAQEQEATGTYRTAVSVVGGLSVGSSGSPRLGLDRFIRGFDGDGGAAFTVGGSVAHDFTPRLTFEATGLYQDRGSSAWSADAGLRLNLKPSSQPVVPYFAVSGGLYGESTNAAGFDIRPAMDAFRDFRGQGPRHRPGLPGDIGDLVDDFLGSGSSSRTDGMMTLGGGVVLAAGPHVFVRPDARAQVVFSGNTQILGLFTLNFGYRF
jgi:hypothetical protein